MRSADAFTGALWCPRCHVCCWLEFPGRQPRQSRARVTCDRHMSAPWGTRGQTNLVSSPTSVLQKRISLLHETLHFTRTAPQEIRYVRPCRARRVPRRARRVFQSNLVHVVACADDIMHPPIHSSLAHNGYRYCTWVTLLSTSRTFLFFISFLSIPFRVRDCNCARTHARSYPFPSSRVRNSALVMHRWARSESDLLSALP
jgi:hypothetical protein